MGACVRTYIDGATEANGSFTCWMDDADTNGQAALPIKASVTLKLYPDGAGSGKPSRSMTATIQQVREGAAVDGLVERDYTFFATTVVDRTPQA